MSTKVKDAHLSLIDACVRGENTAFRLLYQQYQQKVRSTLYQLCGSSILDDLVQEVFLRVWRGLPTLKRREYFSTWLYRITWNVATDQRQSFAQQHSLRTQLQVQQMDLSFHSTPDQDDLISLHYQDLVERGLSQLSLDHRSVIVLHDLEDLPQKEVAEILGIPLGTVKSRLFHARSAMRQFLEQEGVPL